jgi:anti-sigma B factor antagonist
VNSPLKLSTGQDSHGNTVLAVAGEIDMSNAADFRDALSQAGTNAAAFTVDLTQVDYLDSAGLTALLPYADRIKITATSVLAPVLSVTGLDAITTVVSDAAEGNHGK